MLWLEVIPRINTNWTYQNRRDSSYNNNISSNHQGRVVYKEDPTITTTVKGGVMDNMIDDMDILQPGNRFDNSTDMTNV